MNIARILYPVEVLGPGRRIGIWVAGCNHFCKGCSNPELWKQRPEYEISVEKLIDMLEAFFEDKPVDGFIVTGGEPFNQAEDLYHLTLMLKKWSDDILVYTGYTIEELHEKHSPSIEGCLSNIGVLIDGRYVEEQNKNSTLRGSENQRIIYLNQELTDRYETYMSRYPNRIQNFDVYDGVVSVGIHKAGFKDTVRDTVNAKGVSVGNG